ncbi:hypothetical protein SUGI_0380570 [Cryptomeria japonica]|uniref:uncharacterized protein LOC131065560 isoform X2 n=1 Tax=Cryptomeria japonica TaxID=3369 RepID=UPI002408979A|nr:uncharacterized protein LOC131065560 isoform X2 [Cryptomeria japonica]GLJ20863.1 hypothetical protein SUGI_0380570 [Cryptomeria japonica]
MEVQVLLLSLIFLAVGAAADGINGCGGFVEASPALIKLRKPTDPKLDYSHITVELHTVDGLVKEWTQCAPNGYYFIPVYDKGSFVIKIKGPDGWSWKPDQVPVSVDNNGCNGNEDINFHFTGFTVSGRVVGAVGGESCPKINEGPGNVKVELISTTSKLSNSVFTSHGGSYNFKNIIPGTYKLVASHPILTVEQRGSHEIDVDFSNLVVDDIFFVPGYDIDGLVVSQGNPVLGVHVYLYSDDVVEVHCPQGAGTAPWEKQALCHAISDANGRFAFKSIPCGKYRLLPFYKGENTIFDVSPPSMELLVEHTQVTISQPFQVTGFSVGGRVVNSQGIGVEGVKILVDGRERARTDIWGYYKLDQVTSTRYTIKAEKEHFKFSSLENFMVLPNMASIPDIKATHYNICGSIKLITAGFTHKRQVALTHVPENVKPQIKKIDEMGDFCFEVPPGDYRVSPHTTSLENASGLLFSPPHVDVTMNGPFLGIEFTQALVNIRGSAICKGSCDSMISVSLSSPSVKNSESSRSVSLSGDSSDFVFEKVLPGAYHLEIKHGPSFEAANWDDDWCWEKKFIDVEVGIADLAGITFVQKGYWLHIKSTHVVNASILQPNRELINLPIEKGWQRTCLETPGSHTLQFLNSCIFFGTNSLEFNTLDLKPLYLTGKKYLLSGQIHIKSDIIPDSNKMSESITVDVWQKDGTFVDVINNVKHVSSLTGSAEVAVYEFTHWANLGDELIFVPQDIRNVSGQSSLKKILFYPREHHVAVKTDGCQRPIPPFVGRLGHYVEGSVLPALHGVDIRIIAHGDSSNVALKKGDLALSTSTGSDGLFSGGPLYDDTDYYVEASKEGYHLKPLGGYSFSCQKLSEIVVHIYAGEGAEESLPSVLLSLSGEDGYRNNSVSAPGGAFNFENLFPGSFFLRPLLKEYSFSPSAQAIELGSGEIREVTFAAHRVAYSILGTVTSLSGQPREGITLEARSQSKGYYEETTTDISGKYRLRGLLPNSKYSVKVVVKEDSGNQPKIERASPSFVDIEVASTDISGLDFVVFDQPEMTIVTGHVDGTDLEKLQPHLTVQIKSASEPFKIESLIPLRMSNFFEVQSLPKGRYLVQLLYGLPSKFQKFESDILEVDLEKQTQIHVGPLSYRAEEHNQKLDLTPAPAFPLIVGVLVIAVFVSMPRFKDAYQWAVGLAPSGMMAISSKKDMRKLNIRRKTY